MKINRIESLRKSRQISRKKLSIAVGVDESTIFRIEQKQMVSSMDMLIKIADALDCDIAYLLNESNEIRKVRKK